MPQGLIRSNNVILIMQTMLFVRYLLHCKSNFFAGNINCSSKMKYRFLRFLLPVKMVMALLLLTANSSAQHTSGSKSQPNFVILIADDQRWDQLSYADHPIIPELHTPNQDRLAKSGVYFRNTFITSPVCTVSRASIATGMYESTHGMNHFNTAMRPEMLDQTYAAVMHRNGYRTGMLGKWGVGTDGTEKIFDVFHAWAKQGDYFHKTDTGMIHNEAWLAIEARKFLASCKPDQPFCLTVCFKSPHHPYQPDPRDKNLFADVQIPKRRTDTPEGYEAMSARVMDSSLNRWCYFDERKDEATKDHFEKNFLRCVMSLDRAVGEVCQSIKDLHLDKNTYIIYISDNGYLWGEHGLGGKWLLYEESIRVPLMITGPGIPSKMLGKKLDDLALNIDLAPTILDIAGLPIPTEMDGKSLWPKLKGSKAPLRSDFYMEHVNVIKVETPIPDSRGIRTRDWKYIRYVSVQPQVEEIYDLKHDHLEMHNLIHDKKYAAMREKLRQRYEHYIQTLKVEDPK